jgi:hypothetical protein
MHTFRVPGWVGAGLGRCIPGPLVGDERLLLARIDGTSPVPRLVSGSLS